MTEGMTGPAGAEKYFWRSYDDASDPDLLTQPTQDTAKPARAKLALAKLLRGMGVMRVLGRFQYKDGEEDRFLRSRRGYAGNETFVGRLYEMNPIEGGTAVSMGRFDRQN